MTMICNSDDRTYRRSNSEKRDIVVELYDSLKPYQREANNGVRKFIFGKLLSNIVTEAKMRYDKTIRVSPQRLSNDQMRFLRKSKRLAEELEIPFAEVVYACHNVGHIGSVTPNTIIALGRAMLELDRVTNVNCEPLEHYVVRALHIHVEGLPY